MFSGRLTIISSHREMIFISPFKMMKIWGIFTDDKSKSKSKKILFIVGTL